MSPTTAAAKRERAWFRRQKGYILQSVRDDVSRLEKRLVILEALLTTPGQRRFEESLHPDEE